MHLDIAFPIVNYTNEPLFFSLSSQVKIWFQNRRAKERKVVRKREEMLHREKLATMVHMQNAAAIAASGGGPMCNQPNGPPVNSLM